MFPPTCPQWGSPQGLLPSDCTLLHFPLDGCKAKAASLSKIQLLQQEEAYLASVDAPGRSLSKLILLQLVLIQGASVMAL